MNESYYPRHASVPSSFYIDGPHYPGREAIVASVRDRHSYGAYLEEAARRRRAEALAR